jgi:hypothetical protein
MWKENCVWEGTRWYEPFCVKRHLYLFLLFYGSDAYSIVQSLLEIPVTWNAMFVTCLKKWHCWIVYFSVKRRLRTKLESLDFESRTMENFQHKKNMCECKCLLSQAEARPRLIKPVFKRDPEPVPSTPQPAILTYFLMLFPCLLLDLGKKTSEGGFDIEMLYEFIVSFILTTFPSPDTCCPNLGLNHVVSRQAIP